jgi:putative proteasome-type protease
MSDLSTNTISRPSQLRLVQLGGMTRIGHAALAEPESVCGPDTLFPLHLTHKNMTYCVAIKLNAGLVFLSDSRTNAGLDQISTFRKMIVYEKPGDRFMVLLSAGNLSISQSVREILQVEQLKEHPDSEPITIWNAKSMFDAARVLGSAIRHVYERDSAALQRSGVDFNVSLIFGGQIRGEGMRLFQVYSPGNFIESTPETPYFQVGESKYGKPVLDRVITPTTPLDEAAKCVLVSMDSTLKSNLSVGLPLDLVVYEVDHFQTDKVVCIDENNPYLKMLHSSWGEKLREVFDSIEDPMWNGEQTNVPLTIQTGISGPLRKITKPDERLI